MCVKCTSFSYLALYRGFDLLVTLASSQFNPPYYPQAVLLLATFFCLFGSPTKLLLRLADVMATAGHSLEPIHRTP